MKLEEKIELIRDVCYCWKMDEIQTESDCYRLAETAAKLGELERIECQGYFDMDTHENYCSFQSVADFTNGLEKVKKIDADTITVFAKVDGKTVTFAINPVWDNKGGTTLSISGPEETVRKVSSVLKKKLG